MSAPSVRSLAILLAMLVAVAPFAIDMYLPAMKIMATDLSTAIHYVEISISTFLFGFAIGQLTRRSTLRQVWAQTFYCYWFIFIFNNQPHADTNREHRPITFLTCDYKRLVAVLQP